MNNEILKGILLFLAGGAAGAGVTGFIFKRKLNEMEESIDDIVEERVEEIAEIRMDEDFDDEEEDEEEDDELDEESDDEDDSDIDEEKLTEITQSVVKKINRARTAKPDPIELAKELVDKNNYVSYSGKKDPVTKNETPDDYWVEQNEPEDIEIISPQEFGDIAGYDKVNLYFLSRDEVLVDDEGNPVENIVSLIGPDALENFGTYEPDSVCVRNNRLETDFAIFIRNETLSNFSL